jgi:uncharacterized protein
MGREKAAAAGGGSGKGVSAAPAPSATSLHPALTVSKRDGVVQVKVHVVPRAKDAGVAVNSETIEVRLAAAPVEGEANRECVEVMARFFGVSKTSVALVAGAKAREKVLALPATISAPAAQATLQAAMSDERA